MDEQPYLVPYVNAARRFGSGFGSLLWASPRTQRARFEAIIALHNPTGGILLDVGCGRGDLLSHMLEQDAWPAQYIGIEAVPQLAQVARELPGATIIEADFVREPTRLLVGADLIVFSGSLNTLEDRAFYDAIRVAFDAARDAVAFNFLCSPYLAGREYLHWREPGEVLSFARSLGADVRTKDDYLRGDCTMCLTKPRAAARSDRADGDESEHESR